MVLRYLFAAIGALVTIIGLAPAAPAAAQTTAQRCFPETGQCISGPIRAYWERNGGLPVFGFPITEQRTETVEGRTIPVQWFERDRLEIQRDGTVTAGRLGARLLELQNRPWQNFPSERPISSPECRYFAETRFNVCGWFLGYWERNGGLERFGYPISPAKEELVEGRALTVQYFERRRMEYHPQNAYPYDVLLGLLGREVRDLERGNDVIIGQPIDVEREQARITLMEFLSGLSRRDYGPASDLYGGDMGLLASWNPDIVGDLYGDRKTRAALFQRGCQQNGLVCIPVKGSLREEQLGPRSYRFTVELDRGNGQVYRHPITGQTQWVFDVTYFAGRTGEGYRVMQLPPYVN